MAETRGDGTSRNSRAGKGRSEADASDGRRATGRRTRPRYDERQQKVVDIAAHVFAAKGYHATTIDDLVEATGLQRGGLYHYMNGKKDLLIAIHERFIDPLLADAEEIVSRGEGPEPTLRLLARALMNSIATYNDQVTVFLHEWRSIKEDPEWVGIRASRERFEKLIGRVLADGHDQGIFVIRDHQIALLAFLGMINYSYEWYRPGGRAKAQTIADEFCEIFLSGIRAKPPSSNTRR